MHNTLAGHRKEFSIFFSIPIASARTSYPASGSCNQLKHLCSKRTQLVKN